MRRNNVKVRKLTQIFLSLSLLIALIALPTTDVSAAQSQLSMPGTVTVGDTFTVTYNISPAVNIQTGFDVNINYDASGLTYNGGSPSSAMSEMSESFPGGGSASPLVIGFLNGSASAGTVFSLRFTAKAAGSYTISAGEASYGTGYAAGSAQTVRVEPRAAEQPPALTTTPPLPTVGPTPSPTTRPPATATPAPVTAVAAITTPGPVPPVTLEDSTMPEPEAPVTDPQTGQTLASFYTFEGDGLAASEAEIPAERIPLDYEAETITVNDVDVRTLRAPNRPRLFWFEDESGEPDFYLHWQAEDRYLPYRVIRPFGEAFIIVPPPSDAQLPPEFALTTLEIDGDLVPAYQADAEAYETIFSEQGIGSTEDVYVVYARVLLAAKAEEETPEETSEENPEETPEDTSEDTEEPLQTAAETPAEPTWQDGEFYLYDQTRNMLFPFSLLIVPIPEPTPAPTPEPTPTPTPEPTEPVETIPVDPEPVISVFGYEYGLWKAIIFVLGFLLLATWLILLLRSLGRKSRELERERELEAAIRAGHRARSRIVPPVTEEEPLSYDEKPDRPAKPLVTPPVKNDIKVEEEESKAPTPKRTRDVDLPEMPKLKEPRPSPLPPRRNETRTHADEMVLRPLPEQTEEPEPKPEPKAERTPEPEEKKTTPDVPSEEKTPPRPMIRRVDPNAMKPKIRRVERPVIDDEDNSEI